MVDKSDNTIRLDQKDESTIQGGDTIRIPESSDTVRIDNTQRIDQKQIISSGLGGGLNISAGTKNVYELNGTRYELLEKISESTTEAQIFLVAKGKQKYILKYYYPFVKPKTDVIEKLRSFSHPDIVKVIDSGYFEERFFEITTYADQGSLLKHIPINDVKTIKNYVKEIANALEHCHTNGIIHRDIKPANIFIKDKKKNDIIVGDFGIASIVGSDEDLRRTSIFQTPIYAAPEYRMTLGGQTIISKAVDYYALGITVWEMWSGKLPPDGMDDLEFLRLMFEGTPPLPAGMDDEIAYLIKGLTTRDYKKRWGYEEVQKWLKGNPVDLYVEENVIPSKSLNFGEAGGKKITVNQPKELAKLLHEHPDLGRKHLYRGTIKEWLKKIGDQRLYIEIADIVEYRFKDDEITGTKYAAYVVDREYPFVGTTGNQCNTKDQLVAELKKNFTKYKTELKEPNHSLFLYLLSKNMEKEVEQFRHYFKTLDGETALYYLIYSLIASFNPKLSFHFGDKKNSKIATTIKEAADHIYHDPSLVKTVLSSKEFFVWLEFKDKEICKNFKEYVAKNKKAKSLDRLLPYVLDPEKGYVGLKGKERKTLEEIGWDISENYKKYIELLKDPDFNLYYYFEAKGYTGEIEFYQKAFNMEMAANKSGVYNDYIAICKIIKSTGCSMRISPGGIPIKTQEDLKKNYSKLNSDIKKDLSDPQSFMSAWLAVFYHEEPMSDDGDFYIYFLVDYEVRLKNYFIFLSKLDSSNKLAKNYKEAVNKIKKITTKFTGKSFLSKAEKYITWAIPVLAAVLLFMYTIIVDDNHLPGNAFDLNSIYYIVFAVLTAGFLLWSGYEESDFSLTTSCIGGPVVGAIFGFIVYYIFYFIISIPLFLGIALIVMLYFLIMQLNLFRYKYEEIQNDLELEIDQEEMDIAAFKYAFGKTDDLELPSLEKKEYSISQRRFARVKLWGLSIAFAMMFLAVLALLIYYNPNIPI